MDPLIDLNDFEEGKRIWGAMLRTFDPKKVDEDFRRRYDTDFEAMRSGYPFPREPRAYVVTNYRPEEGQILSSLGFALRP